MKHDDEMKHDDDLLPDLPNVSKARLPETHKNAVIALERCMKTDECQKWAKKAEALASYAKQANDTALRKMADRIQARAIRRCGELLQQIKSESKANLKQGSRRAGALPSETRALRVANVPKDQFDKQVESENPPTAGWRSKERSPPQMGCRRTTLAHARPSKFKQQPTLLG
jgi:hypothetical protein